MAIQGKPIPASVMAQIQKLRQSLSLRATARATGTSPKTVIKYGGRKTPL